MSPVNRQTILRILSLVLLTIPFGIFFTYSFVSAEDASSNISLNPDTISKIDTLKQNISTSQSEVKRLETEITDFTNKLTVAGNQKKTLQSEMKTIDLTRAQLAANIKLTQVKIANTTNTISSLSNNIGQKQARIEKNKNIIGDIIHKIDQRDSNNFIETMLGNKSISDVVQDVDDLSKLQVSIRDNITSLQRLKDDLGAQKTSYEGQQKQLVGLKGQLGDQKLLADQQRRENDRLLSDTKNQESNYKKLLATKLAAKKQFEREIDNYEIQLRAVIDPNSFPHAGTKVFQYPLDNVRVTQKFGRTVDSVRLYAAGTHNGVDFAASPGTPIKAVGDGIVLGTGDTDIACRGASYGRWVMIKHPNGLSTIYGHLQLIKVGTGQEVSAGDTIGYSGATGYETGPHLHLGVFVSSVVKIVDLPSKSCTGAVFRIPVSPLNGYLDPLSYM